MSGKKLKAHLLTLPRWFGIPFFGASALLGVVIAGGSLSSIYTWLALLTVLFVMAGGHSFNTLLDYWTGLDRGEVEDRSAEKYYTGGQNVIGNGTLSEMEVLLNSFGWYILSLIPIAFIILHTMDDWIFLPWLLGCLCTFWYSISKFNYTHELALGVAVGPLPALVGALSLGSSIPVMNVILASLPMALTLSFLGLALDEWTDAEANLQKGVKSIAFMVWKYTHEQGITGLLAYCYAWLIFLIGYHVLLIATGILHPLTSVAFICLALLIPIMVMLGKDFKKFMIPVVAIAGIYCILVVVGQAI